MAFTILSVLWTAAFLLAPGYLELPPAMAMIPVLVAFAMRIASTLVLYRLRVDCGLKSTLLAGWAGLALAPTFGRAVLHALVARNLAAIMRD